MKSFFARRPPITLLVVLVLLGFLLVTTANATSAENRTQEPRRQALIDQILHERQNVGDLDKAVDELHGQVSSAQDAAARSSQQQEQQNQAQQDLALRAGTTAVKGSGLLVKLSDAPRQTGDDAKFDASRIQDSDIQLVVNALFAAGAEAVAVNDNRVVAVTPIRAAGGTIVVNYRPVNSPYRIAAIGADAKRFSQSVISDHFSQWKKKFNLGFSVEKHKSLTLPAYSGRVGIDLAQPNLPASTTSTSEPDTTSTTASGTSSTSTTAKRAS
jgi:uncharacterized protein YlxW (UPF0749 family)